MSDNVFSGSSRGQKNTTEGPGFRAAEGEQDGALSAGEGSGAAPERSPGSLTAGAERGPLHPGSAHQGRWERVWLALATGMGFTLLEAAQAAYGAQQALQRARHRFATARADLRERATRAGRGLFSAALRMYGWELMPRPPTHRYHVALQRSPEVTHLCSRKVDQARIAIAE